MHRACTRLRQRNPNLFIVESLFANNEQGVWYDPSDMNTLFQDAAGTTPVTATGQPVGRILDKSGNGNHATQPTAGSRPTFRDVDGLRFLDFDGSDDFLVTANINFSASDEMSVFSGVRKILDVGSAVVAELSVSSTANNGSFGLFAPLGGTPTFSYRSRGSIMIDATSGADYTAPISAVLTGLSDISGDLSSVRTNGIQVNNTGDQGSGNYGDYPLYIGRRAGTTLNFRGNIYGLIVRGVLTNSVTISSTESYIAYKTGVTLA